MRVPFSLIPERSLKRISRPIVGFAEIIKPFFPYLELDLKQSQADVNPHEYLAMCITATTFFFFFIFILALITTFVIAIENFVVISSVVAIILSLFAFIQQTIYPKLVAARRIKDIDRNLLPALRTLLIHINSGIPLFDTILAIAKENFGEVSIEFRRIVRKVNSGFSAVDAIEESASNNPSGYYRRALWQLANGMKAGSDTTVVMQEVINNLSKEQLIQIESYGSQLSPLAMFYMIMAVIIPALAMTMLIILSSFLSLEPTLIKFAFYGIYGVVLLFQIMFLGLIKTRRPNLIALY